MTRPTFASATCWLGGLAALTSVACGPSVVNLSYQPGTYARKVSPVRLGVYYLQDERPGWPATAAMRMFERPQGATRAFGTPTETRTSTSSSRDPCAPNWPRPG